ncbi:MAG: aminotransferase class V-fold PLP-dependent enzyme [Oscillatoriales cyanobacterium RM2_1_1]|nr:aminotransferase class V-fold PLP-dependent enzyme [Oscillatoriales cyanobacterium SM2_3_0]NJO45914.1 aminotransferase class V-fold PLP-dependent enzyme [Oscillatoriales cyanobacterium RM2_1_1]
MLDQTQTPLLDQLKHSARRSHSAFYAPGHKGGQGISQSLRDLLGIQVFQADLPELPELDNLFAPTGVIQQAQALAAEAFGAEQTWFLTNGSTAGVIGAILATCGFADDPGHGQKIIVPRNAHQSVISGLVLSGAIAIFVTPDYDPDWDLVGPVSPESIAQALEVHPDARAVLIVSPTYQGICSDVGAIGQIVHQYNIPLLVDEAHGPHFGFHPDLPDSALSWGADLVVQSTHKVLGAMTQAAMVHVQGDRINRQSLSRALQLVQSTSPSYLLLASLDAARQQMATQGKVLLARTLQLAGQAQAQLQAIAGIEPFQLAFPAGRDGHIQLDPTRLTVRVTDLGLRGYEADEILHQHLGVTAELPNLKHLTFILSLGNTVQDIENLVQGFRHLAQRHCPGNAVDKFPAPSVAREIFQTIESIIPRTAFFARTVMRGADQAVGCVSSEWVCPYPPGIPSLLPGERITLEAIDYLRQVLAWGGVITGCSDPSLQTLRVLADP